MIGSAILLALGLTAAQPAPSGWSPRQETLIRAANAVLSSDSWALMNACRVSDGRVRYDAARSRLEGLKPRLASEIGDYAVHEIFVIRAPRINPQAIPPARCRPLRRYDPEREGLMSRFENAVDALAMALDTQ